jgi:SulP family sulfate permease
VNFDAGAETPAAGAFTAVGLAFAALALTPLIFFLPKATLAATIIVAVLSLVDLSILTQDMDLRQGRFRRRRRDDLADPRPRAWRRACRRA